MTAERDADQLLGEVHRHGADIQVEDAELVLYGGERIPPELKAELKAYKAKLIRNLSADEGRLLEALATATDGLSITSGDVYEALDAEETAAFHAGRITALDLLVFAQDLHNSLEREAGRVPDDWEHVAYCRQCGPVWLFTSGKVPDCPWCLNRLSGRPIPRPEYVKCRTCQHFRRTGHLNLGRCAAGVPALCAAGHWDTDQHECSRWLPSETSTERR